MGCNTEIPSDDKDTILPGAEISNEAEVKSVPVDNEPSDDIERPSISASAEEEDFYWPTEDFRYSTPERHGVDSIMLTEFMKEAKNSGAISSFILIRDGYIIAESYFGSQIMQDIPSQLYSCTKSFTSALFGIAVKDEKIIDLDAKVLDLFPEKQVQDTGNGKENITLRHLLTMTAGLDWPINVVEDLIMDLIHSIDPVQFVLDRPMTDVPGEKFSYNSGASQVIIEYIQKSIGADIYQYAEDRLFKPIGILDYTWDKINGKNPMGFSGLKMKAKDMAKFGYLYLNKGKWEQGQLLSETWVEESTIEKISDEGFGGQTSAGYGYYWWINSFGGYSARGMKGQYIIILPEKSLVTVFQGNFLPDDQEIPLILMRDKILPSIVSDNLIEENIDAYEKLLLYSQ